MKAHWAALETMLCCDIQTPLGKPVVLFMGYHFGFAFGKREGRDLPRRIINHGNSALCFFICKMLPLPGS